MSNFDLNSSQRVRVRTPERLGPSDTAITAALQREGNSVVCMRYRICVGSNSEPAAEELLQKVITVERARLRNITVTPNRVSVVASAVFREMGQVKFIRDKGQVVYAEYLRWWRGVEPLITLTGRGSLMSGDDDAVTYEYRRMVLHGKMGARISAVWGIDGQPGTWRHREDVASQALLNVFQTHGDLTGPMGSRIAELEVRNIKIGDGDAGPVFGYQVIALHPNFQQRLNVISPLLADMGLELITMYEYRERLMALKAAGNQEDDSLENVTEGRKMMVWGLPRQVSEGEFNSLCKTYLGSALEAAVVTASRKNWPYGWFVMDSSEQDRITRACLLEVEMQRKWGPGDWGALCTLQVKATEDTDARPGEVTQRAGG
jgi:hypothetical protein